MYPRPRLWPSIAAVLLFCCATALAQEGPKLSAAGEEAFEKYQQGDLKGAVEGLEAARDNGSLTPVDESLLGTLYIAVGRPADGLTVLKPIADDPAADPAVLYNAGRAALAAGQIEDGAAYLERSVQQLPASPAARELGILRGAQARHEDAYQLLRPWVTENPSDVQARLAAIAAALELDRAAQVGPWFEGLPIGAPKVVMLRGQYLGQIGDLESAVLAFESILENHPPEMRSDLYRQLGRAYVGVGRSSDAIALLSGKLGQEPFGQDPLIALALAEAHHLEGDSAAAAAVLAPFARLTIAEQATGGYMLFEMAHNYGRYLTAAGRAEDAMPFLDKAVAVDPENPEAWQTRGDALAAAGRADEAAEALEKRRALLESQAKAAAAPGAKAIAEARGYVAAGENQRALAILRQEIALSPNDLQVRLLEIHLLMVLKRHAEALKSAEAAVVVAPSHPDALYYRGAVQMASNAPEAAEADFRRAIELNPDHTAAMNDLAVILMVQGKKGEAQALLERVLELLPSDAMARQNLERLKS